MVAEVHQYDSLRNHVLAVHPHTYFAIVSTVVFMLLVLALSFFHSWCSGPNVSTRSARVSYHPAARFRYHDGVPGPRREDGGYRPRDGKTRMSHGQSF